ncbi:MAG: FoF1 ATP synthase subunit a [Candidatus Caenarcaniphilales bacterium]|nr:FoF1 ATP synthase subunit a [Candidatus Caenarcaniphilales bacterium]
MSGEQIADRLIEDAASKGAENAETIHHCLFHFGGQTIHIDTILSVWGIMLAILLFSFLATRKLLKTDISPLQFVLEGIYDLWDNQIRLQTKWKPDLILSFVATIFVFVLASYFYGLLPWKIGMILPGWPQLAHGHPWEGASPLADLNITAAMALVSVLAYLLAGSLSGGLSYWAPYFFLNYHHGKLSFNMVGPLEWLDMVIRPLTLSLRLFANTFAGEALVGAIIKLVPLFVPIIALAFESLIGVLQAFIFAMLSTVYISIATSHAEEVTEEHATSHH